MISPERKLAEIARTGRNIEQSVKSLTIAIRQLSAAMIVFSETLGKAIERLEKNEQSK